MRELVFEILAEGGGLKIERIKNDDDERFFYHQSEFDASDQGLNVSANGEYKTFKEPFQLVNSRYKWFDLHLHFVHEDYKDYVIHELIKALNFHKIEKALPFADLNLEQALGIELIYDYSPINSDVQNITVTNLMKLTEYHYKDFEDDLGNTKRLYSGKYEIWTDEQIYSRDYNEIIRHKEYFSTIGIIEVNGNTVIIKDKDGRIEYVLPSDKYFISTKPILSQNKSWTFQKVK